MRQPATSTAPPTAAAPLLRVKPSEQGTTRTVTVAGEIDVSCVQDVRVVVDRALDTRPETLLLDLSAIDFCDSSGIHLVLQTQRRAKLQRTRFLVIPPVGAAKRIFELCAVQDEVALVPTGD